MGNYRSKTAERGRKAFVKFTEGQADGADLNLSGVFQERLKIIVKIGIILL